MSKPISIQLYTVRDLCAQDFFGTLEEIAKIGYIGVEFAGLHGKSPQDVAAKVKSLGLKVSSSHVGLPTSETVNQMVDIEKVLGNNLLITGFGPDDFKTVELCKRSAAQFQEAAQLVKERGLRFGVHNHWWEFHKVDGRLAYDILMEEAPDLHSELDIYWVAFGGADPVDIVRRYKSRIPVLHVKDGPLEPDKPHTAVGKGKVPVPAVINAADPSVLEWLIVELDSCGTDMMEAVRDSYTYLTSTGLASGRI